MVELCEASNPQNSIQERKGAKKWRHERARLKRNLEERIYKKKIRLGKESDT